MQQPRFTNPVVSEQTQAQLRANSEHQKAIQSFQTRFVHIVKSLLSSNEEEIDTKNIILSYAPGRINLIGEHVDYLGGAVLPAAIDKGIYAFGIAMKTPPKRKLKEDADGKDSSTSSTSCWTFICHDGKEVQQFTEEENSSTLTRVAGETASSPRWTRYVEKTFNQVLVPMTTDSSPSEPNKMNHFYVAVFSTLPVGAGLSSSAAFNISIANLVAKLKNKTPTIVSATLPPAGKGHFRSLLDEPATNTRNNDPAVSEYASRLHLALLAQKTEHQTGTNCGIMDQLASLFGAPATCLVTDCDKCAVSPLPLDKLTKAGARFLLINSIVPHELGDAYNKLRAALERAQTALAAHFGKETFSAVEWATDALNKLPNEYTSAMQPYELAEMIGKDFKKLAVEEAKVSAEDALKLSYVVEETVRTRRFIVELMMNQHHADHAYLLTRLGDLLNATHKGLSEILNVSTPELDFIQQYMQEHGLKSGNNKFKCYGSRMMGGGFGGCVLCLIQSDEGNAGAVEKFMKEEKEFMPVFAKKFFPDDKSKQDNFCGEFYDVMIGGGATIA